MTTTSILLISFLGGISPALIWLWFWLKEDSLHPEPKKLLALAFFSGMIAMLAVLPFQKIVYGYFKGNDLILFSLCAIIEEVLKFLVAYFTVLKRKEDNEPLDPLIYMITVAIGFAALENSFFLLSHLFQGDMAGGIITSGLRFIGATLLHIVSSATIGVSMSLSFYKNKVKKSIYLAYGLLLAIILHTFFNLLIIKSNGNSILTILSGVWFAIVILLLVFEKIKKINSYNK